MISEGNCDVRPSPIVRLEYVLKALLNAVAEFGKENGLDTLSGPWGFNDTDREGMLTYGFNELSNYATNYSYPYYVRFFEELGFKKESEWIEYEFNVEQNDEKFTEHAKKLRELGINTIGDLAHADYDRLYKYFKNQTLRLINSAKGIDESVINVERKDEESISNSTTLSYNLTTIEQIYKCLYPLTENVCRQLRSKDKYANQVGVILKDKNFKTYSHQRKLKNPNNNCSCDFKEQIIVLSDPTLLADGQILDILGDKIKVIHTPGHTQGSMSYLVDNTLFSGDTLFKNTYGRCDLPGGDFEQIKKSLTEKLFVLPDDVVVYSGHGEKTTIGYEKINNEIL